MATPIKNWLLALGAAFVLAACGAADDTVQAKLEQAQIEIDSGNYAVAVTILQEVCDPADLAACEDPTLMMLAEAYMGTGGVDLLNLLAEAAGGTSPNTFTMIQNMAGAADAAAKVAALDNAILALEAMSVLDANADLILAVATTTHAVMLITSSTDATPILTGVISDLEGMLAAVAALEAELGLPTNLTDDLSALIAEIGGTDDGINVTLSDADLQYFIDNLP